MQDTPELDDPLIEIQPNANSVAAYPQLVVLWIPRQFLHSAAEKWVLLYGFTEDDFFNSLSLWEAGLLIPSGKCACIVFPTSASLCQVFLIDCLCLATIQQLLLFGLSDFLTQDVVFKILQ